MQELKGKTTQQNWVGHAKPLVPQLETPMQIPGKPEECCVGRHQPTQIGLPGSTPDLSSKHTKSKQAANPTPPKKRNFDI